MAREGMGGEHPGNGHPAILLRPAPLVLFVEVVPTLRGRSYSAQALLYEDGVRRAMHDLTLPLSFQTRRNRSYRVEVMLSTRDPNGVVLVVHAASKPGSGAPPDCGESAPIEVSPGHPQVIAIDLVA